MSLKASYQNTYNSYSGADIVAAINLPIISTPLVIGELQTISYSIHREVVPVRSLGKINPAGFTNGPRTIAGSMIFTVFDKNVVYNLVKKLEESSELGLNSINLNSQSVLMDEMPPFDIVITMVNEYGQRSGMVIKGVVIVDEGQVMSIEDMITENTYSYMAQDIQVLKKITDASIRGM